MKSIKAIVFGVGFIIVAMLFLQLAFIFIAVGYNSLAADVPFLKTISGVFRYLVGLPVFLITLFIGGYIVAATAEMSSRGKVVFHCLVVGSLAVGGMTYFAMDYMALTVAGIVTLILSLSGVVAGGLFWLHKHKNISV